MKFTVKEVCDSASEKAFLDLPRTLYANEPNWVCPLDMDIRNVFNPKVNPNFQNGEAIRWTLIDENYQVVGRIAAFINMVRAKKFDQLTGGIGFFECINDQNAAALLFNTAKLWHMKKGMQAMDGPINFGENHVHTGLLVEGFMQPAFGMPYNFPYYKNLFETYGFKTYFSQHSNRLDLSKPIPERILRIASWVQQKNNIKSEYMRKANIRKYAEDFRLIYNDAWRFHEHFTEINQKQIDNMINELKMILIEEMCVFAYVDNEPAGFIIGLPDMNQIFKPLKGKLGLVELVKFLWRKRKQFEWYRQNGILTRGRVIIMGIRPKFQKHGLESAMVIKPFEDIRSLGFREMELSWVGDFNPNMRALQEATGAELTHIHHTYRKLFSEQPVAKQAKTIAHDHR